MLKSNNIRVYLKKFEKEQKNKTKESRRKDIIMSKAENNDSKKQIYKRGSTKPSTGSLKKTDKTHNPLASLLKKTVKSKKSVSGFIKGFLLKIPPSLKI